MSSLHLTIVTPEGVRFEGPVERVVVPGSEGDFGVLPGHERFLSPVRVGEIEILGPRGTMWAAVSEGFAEVTGEKVVLMVDSCEFAADIDTARAERARVQALEKIARLEQSQVDELLWRIEETALQRAIIRIQVARRRS